MDTANKKHARQKLLLAQLEDQQYISFENIARRFSVTTQTARRDVADLERQGSLRRLHGGAMLIGTITAEELRQRRVRNAAGKDRIAAKVASLIPDGSAIFMDTGTTCEAIARALIERENLSVVTYSLRVAAYLREMTDFTIAIPGGFVRPVDGGVFQNDSNEFISNFKFDLAILSVTGVDCDGDLCDDEPAEVAAVRSAMQQSTRTLLAVDSYKFGQRGLVRFGTLADVDIVVADGAAPPVIAALIEKNDLDFHVV